MQFRKADNQAIARGDLTTSFRRWKTAQARVGGQYNIPPYGAIEVKKITQLPAAAVGEAALKRAMLPDVASLCAHLDIDPQAVVYQVDFHFLGDTPVNQPERSTVGADQLAQLLQRLRHMDKQAPWTTEVLRLIAAHPGEPARLLAPQCGQPLDKFKPNVRRLKKLGLTISLETGYRLSPRGEQLLGKLSGSE